MRRHRPVPILLAALLLLVGVACGDDGDAADDAAPSTVGFDEGVAGTITVFAAASLTDVFEELGTAFETAHPGVTVEFSFGPSSGLVTQITEGAPADVIATAAPSNMDDLVEAEAVQGRPADFATNSLELAVPPGNPGGVDGLDDLADEELVVGLCNEEVPCGRFAREALEAAGVEPSIDTNEEDVRALLTKIEAGEVDVGVVYRTDVLAAGDAVEGLVIPEDQNVVASYPIASVVDAPNADGAAAFILFVLSAMGQAALADAGFGPPA
jgi:molybdate transport system substrate-binding protein